MLASFGQGTNAIKSAEQGTGLGLPIAKNLIDLHGGTFTLKSKLRVGTEVIVTFQPERVMSALGPVGGALPADSSRNTIRPCMPAPRAAEPLSRVAIGRARFFANEYDRFRKPVPTFRGHALCSRANSHPGHNGDRLALHQGLHHRPALRALPRLRPHARRDRALDVAGRAGARAHHGDLPRRLAAGGLAPSLPDSGAPEEH